MLAWVRYVKARHPGPLCLFGRSAGAHLAVLTAERTSVSCVIGHGPITDLERLSGTPESQDLRLNYLTPSWPRSQWRRFSPTTRADRLPAERTLLAASAGDRYTGFRQLRLLERVRPQVRTACLPSGAADFMHAPVTQASLTTQHARERRLLASAAS